MTLSDDTRKTDHRGYVLAGEKAPCSECKVLTDLNLLDAKDNGEGDYTILQCETCYGPGWLPMATAWCESTATK